MARRTNAELAVIQPLDNIIDVQAVLGLGGGLDVPDDELFPQRLGDGLRQHGLAGARLTLDKQGLLQYHSDVGRSEQLLRGYIVPASSEFLHVGSSFDFAENSTGFRVLMVDSQIISKA